MPLSRTPGRTLTNEPAASSTVRSSTSLAPKAKSSRQFAAQPCELVELVAPERNTARFASATPLPEPIASNGGFGAAFRGRFPQYPLSNDMRARTIGRRHALAIAATVELHVAFR